MTERSTNFKPVTKDAPCRICGRSDWCRRSDDGCDECHRKADDAPGYKLMRKTSSGFGLYRSLDDNPAPAKTNGRAKLSKPKGNRKPYANLDEVVKVTMRRLKGSSEGGEWEYRDADGNEAFVVVRFELSDGDKTFRPYHPVKGGYMDGDPDGPLPLYRLYELLETDGAVHVLEGERKADMAAEFGFVGATCSAHGANAPRKTDWAWLAKSDRPVFIWRDNDEAGREYGDTVASILRRTVHFVNLPDLPVKGDIVDFVKARRDAGLEDDEIRAELQQAVDNAETLEPEAVEEDAAAPLAEFTPFPTDVLPEPIKSFVKAVALAIGCDESFVALPALVAAASAIGNSRCIQVKRGWTEPCILWGAVIGESGSLKSPALRPVVRAIRKRQDEAFAKHDKDLAEYEVEMTKYRDDVKDWEKSDKTDERPIKPEAPCAERYLVRDATFESLVPILQENPRGVLYYRDELSGFFGSFDRYAAGKGGADAANWLSVYDGDGLIVDRKTGIPRTLRVPKACVSVCGGIQPEVMRKSLGRDHFENGMASRLLMAAPPDRVALWREAEIPERAETKIGEMFDRLYAAPVTIDVDGVPQPQVVRFSDNAKRVFIEFFNEHARERLDLVGRDAAAWSKLKGIAARLSLVIHAVRGGELSDHVDEFSTHAGVTLAVWFGREALRIYEGFLSGRPGDTDQRRLIELIQRRGGRITPRVLKQCSRLYPKSADARAALEDLIEDGHGYGQESPTGKKGGRPSWCFVLHDAYITGSVDGSVGGSVDMAEKDDSDSVRTVYSPQNPLTHPKTGVSLTGTPEDGGFVGSDDETPEVSLTVDASKQDQKPATNKKRKPRRNGKPIKPGAWAGEAVCEIGGDGAFAPAKEAV